MNKVYLLLGSNLADPLKQLKIARTDISRVAPIIMQSSVYRTAAWGNPNQPDFLNQVIVIQTELPPAEILKIILDIEHAMGRLRTEKNAPRLIDIDILFYNSIFLKDENLTIPHPHIADRRFVLTPLNEIAPTFIHPLLQVSIERLLDQCLDPLDVKRY